MGERDKKQSWCCCGQGRRGSQGVALDGIMRSLSGLQNTNEGYTAGVVALLLSKDATRQKYDLPHLAGEQRRATMTSGRSKRCVRRARPHLGLWWNF
jgi:hypothetical protein